ncbi:MAG: rhomboid family intramembrane serine protease [Deltaproteobacteria bacterium]|nr:rhomboid family intramembrane serine protease [Deltaproteobacteria bacterium]
MRAYRNTPSFGFGSQLTRLGKNLLLVYAAIYVVELLCEHWLAVPIVSTLQLYALQDPRFQIWQVITHPFFHSPTAPFAFIINCLVFYFFAGPVEKAGGSKRFLILFYGSAAAAALCGLLFNSLAGFADPIMGMLPSLLTLVVVFGLLEPEATILLMFIVPVKAKYLSYGTILLTVLTFLAKVNPHGAYHLGGMLFGYLYVFGTGNLLNYRMWYTKYLELQLKRKKARFKVIQGSKKDKDDKPTYH